MRDEVRTVRVADEVEAYLVAVVRATRTHPDLAARRQPARDRRAVPRRAGGARPRGRAFVPAGRRQGGRARGPGPPARRRPRPRPPRRDRRRRRRPAILATVPRPAGRRRLTRRLRRGRMTGPPGRWLAIVLLLVGAILGVPVAIVLGDRRAALRAGPRRLGAARPRAGSATRRRSSATASPWGERDPAARSRSGTASALPVAWLRAEDETSPGSSVRERDLGDGASGTRVLRNAWTLAPFERVRRQFHVRAERRGVFTIGPVDAVASATCSPARPPPRAATGIEHVPRLAADGRDRRDFSSAGPLGRSRSGADRRWPRTRRGSPASGRTPPGDPIRRIHAARPAPARAAVVKRFEPSRDREVLIALDVQTADGPLWDAGLAERRRRVAVRRSPGRSPGRSRSGASRSGLVAAATRAPRRGSRACRSRRRRARRSGSSTCSRGCRRHASAPFERLLGGRSRGPCGPGRPSSC